MGFFSSLFGGEDEPPPPRTIESPADLRPGDMVKMGFAAQGVISGQTLKVTEQLSYDISAVEKCKIISVMEGGDQRLLISTSQINPDRPLEVAIPILPDTVFKIFKRKRFVAIFDEPDDHSHRIESKFKAEDMADHPEFDGFIGQSYFQERTHEAYRSTLDCRERTLSDSEWSGFDYKLMVSDDRNFAVRIEVFDGGRTDVFLIAYLPLNKIEEYWPA